MSAPYLAGPEIRPFTTFENETIRDPNLSYRALGVLARLRSNDSGYKQDSRALARERPGKEGRDAIRSALRELEEAGYCRRVLARKPDGTIYGQYVFYYGSLEAAAAHQIGDEISVDDEGKPIPDPESQNRGPENPAAGFPGARKTRRPDFQARKRKKEQIRNNKPPPPTPAAAAAPIPLRQATQGGGVDKKKSEEAQEAAEAGVWWQQCRGKEISSVDDLRNHIVGRVLREGLNAKDRQQIAAWRARNEASEDKPTTTGGGPTLADIEREAKPGETYEQVRLRLLRDRDRTTIDKLAAGTVERKTAALKDGRRIS